MNRDLRRALGRGLAGYEDVLARWWLAQANDGPHHRAYRNVARFIHHSFQRPLGLVVDYGCGAGHLLSRLAWRYPGTHFLGLDGSAALIELARRRVARQGKPVSERIRLQHTTLPNFDLPDAVADMVIFAFPHIVPEDAAAGFESSASRLSAGERAIIRDLAGSRGEAAYAHMLRDATVALNLRLLLKPDGVCVRVEYAAARREELSRLDLLRTGMEEGSLDCTVAGNTPRQWFRVLASRYFRSRVIRDVYDQTGSRGGPEGGYTITVLRPIRPGVRFGSKKPRIHG